MSSKFTQALAVSDTHGNKAALRAIVKEYPNVPYLFHMGDYTGDAHYLSDHLKNTKVLNVRGNCDVGSPDPEFESICIHGQKIVLVHGHQLGVKFSYDRAFYYAKENDANALLVGHTHIPYSEAEDGVLIVNPGSAGEPRNLKPTVAMLLIGREGIVTKLLQLHI